MDIAVGIGVGRLGFAALLAVALAACSATHAMQPALSTSAEPHSATEDTNSSYPVQILGHWESGPGPCHLPRDDDTSGFEVGPQLLQGYEYTNVPKAVRQISSSPQAWRIESIEERDGIEDRVSSIFVVDGDHMTVTDGKSATTHIRCRTRDPEAPRYPEALHGEWRMDPRSNPEPCYLPLNSDADGQMVISADRIIAYEATYTPINVEADEKYPDTWHIKSRENYLGSQISDAYHTFTLNGEKLTQTELEGSEKSDWKPVYQAVYMKCKERQEAP